MRLTISQRNLKLFQKTLTCISKIGSELLLEVLDDGVRPSFVLVFDSAPLHPRPTIFFFFFLFFFFFSFLRSIFNL
jgi:hypothetical protein